MVIGLYYSLIKSMNLRNTKKRFFTLIKIISIVFITSAIGLELWNIYALLTNNKIPVSLNPVFWIERFAIAIHLVEGVIAAYKAPSRNKTPIKYGTYTFFVLTG